MDAKINASLNDARAKLEQERAICSLYIDCAKTYIQLSTGALLLSLAFSSEFLGAEKPSLLRNWLLVTAWAFWLLAVLAGVTYQYCAIKYLETIANDSELLLHKRTWPVLVPKSLRDNPFFLYGVMMVFFYGGILIFSGMIIRSLVLKT